MTTTAHNIETICQQIAGSGQPVTFPAVTAAAGLSRTTLYRNPELRTIIEEHRHHNHEPGTLAGLTAEIDHLRTALTELAAKVRHQEERLRRLEHPPQQQTR